MLVQDQTWVNMDGFIIFVTLLSIIAYLLYAISTKKFDYWAKKNVPFVKPLPIFGNYTQFILMQEYIGSVVQKLYQRFPNKPYFGTFYGTEPTLVVKSPELLKHIFTKEFYFFNGREVSEHETKEMVTQNLFLSSDDRWKVVRQNLTPLFSSAKMKNMFHLIEKYNHVLEDTLDLEISANAIVEAKDLCARYTMDCICSCGFGVEANTLKNPVNNPFKYMGDEIFKSTYYKGLKLIFRAIWPSILYGLRLNCFSVNIFPFFLEMLRDVFKSRDYKPSSRNDFIDLLINLKKEGVLTSDSLKNFKTGLDEKVHLKIDDELLAAQTTVFFAAGYDTTASTMSFILYELARNPDVQKRAIEEVDEYLRRNNNKLTYECIKELPYLDACMYETLRLYPVIGNITREVMDTCVLPDGLQLDKGVRIHIPAYSMHRDPDYFPDPEEYRPERFLPENKDDIKPYTYLPYGEGPRLCIGKRFSKMQAISGLVTFLKDYRIELAENMPETVILESRSIIIQTREHGIMLKAFKREGWKQRAYVRD